MALNRSKWTRRDVLHRSGGASIAAVSGLAGCLESGTDDVGEPTSEDETSDGDESNPDSTESDGEATGSSGSEDGDPNDTDAITDMTGEAAVTIELVEGEDGDGAFAFRPDHVRIDAGTLVQWINTHDVFHTITSTDSLEQKTPSGEFRETVSSEGERFEWNADETGTQYYYCEPHAGFMAGTLEIE